TRFAALRPFRPALGFRRVGGPLESGLGRRQARHRHTEGRATDISQTNPVTEFYAVGIAAVLAAYPQLDARTGALAFFNRDLHELADSDLVDRSERILLHNFQ